MTTIEDTARVTEVANGRAGSLWHEVETGFWVANSGGVFLGSIEREQDGRYLARSATYAGVGSFPTLAAAQVAMAGLTG